MAQDPAAITVGPLAQGGRNEPEVVTCYRQPYRFSQLTDRRLQLRRPLVAVRRSWQASILPPAEGRGTANIKGVPRT